MVVICVTYAHRHQTLRLNGSDEKLIATFLQYAILPAMICGKQQQYNRSTSDTLRQHGFRSTTSQRALLEVLVTAAVPLSVTQITERWPDVTVPNQTTLYRALTRLNSAGIIRRVDLNSGIAHFEYTPDRRHHHHLVCLDCGLVEEIERCSVGKLEKKILDESGQFKSIETHNLDFFGHCTACSRH